MNKVIGYTAASLSVARAALINHCLTPTSRPQKMRPFERLRLGTASRDRVIWGLGGLRRLSCWHRGIRATTITSTSMSTLQLPPGLTYDGPLVETASGGAVDWVDYKKIKLYTNAFVISADSGVRSVAHRPPRIAPAGPARLTF